MAATTNYEMDQSSGWTGWIYFAGMMMALSGIFEAVTGLVAIFKHDVYLATPNHLLLMNYSQWGWTHLIIGIVLALSAASLWNGKLWGRIVGVSLALLSAIANFAFIWAYPVWSLTIIALDVAVIYAIIVHGRELKA